MTKFLPLILAIAYAFVVFRFSVWQTKRTLDAKSRPLTDPFLRPVLEKLAQALDLETIKVNLFDIDPVNALAAPDGRIFITRGMYQKIKQEQISPEEFASVIAHELGHVALGHTRRRMIDFTGQNAVGILLGTLISRFLPVIGLFIANAIASVLAARLSRQNEFEADAWASALMVKAGFGTGPQKALFVKLARFEGAAAGETPVWLRSHPLSQDRIAAIEVNEQRWGLHPQ